MKKILSSVVLEKLNGFLISKEEIIWVDLTTGEEVGRPTVRYTASREGTVSESYLTLPETRRYAASCI